MKKILKKVFGDPQIRTVKKLTKRVSEINDLEPKIKKLSDTDLRNQTDKFKSELEKGKMLDEILPEAFATVREAARRTLGQRHFDVQLIGGMGLHTGAVTEMKTGEGKTLTSTLPAYLNALEGKGVHVVTVNDYLAQRDTGWMGEVYDFLGLSVGAIIPEKSVIFDSKYKNEEHDDPRMHHLKPCTRQEAYRADITFGTNNEFGFDYLRDNMVREIEQLRQRDLNFAIVDEVDSILIDEARTPLIISAPSTASSTSYQQFAKVVRQLERDKHYEVDEKRKQVALNDDGVDLVEKILGIDNLYGTGNIRTIYHLDKALRAQALFKRDKDYVVTSSGEIVIVDEFTGRLLAGRRYNEGLHQAIEAKENVEIQEESQTLATISFQNYFRLYKKLSGMTGTALTEAEEFHMIYKLEVLEIPPHKKLIRKDLPDKIFKNEAGKFKALIAEVKKLHKNGQPVLIGTASIEKNEKLTSLLKKAEVPHQVLNAKNNEREAAIIAKAGTRGAVTLATNIAGRGTDIVLDEDSKKAGGLFVVGSERHEARRIDNQLRGRSGRQGDPGATQFFVSCEDHLMRVFGGERIMKVMDRMNVDDDTPVENRVISKSLEGAQKKVEGFNFDARKNVVKYDDVMNRHRKATYMMRSEILKQADISKRIKIFIHSEAKDLANSPQAASEDYEAFVKEVFPFDEGTLDHLFDQPAEKFEEELIKAADELYKEQEERFTPEILRKVERDAYLQILDNFWMQHLENMEHLREGIHWMGVGQKDPLVEYRKQSQIIFEQMQRDLRHDVVRALFHARPLEQSELNRSVETELTRAARGSVDNADKIIEGQEFEEAHFASEKKQNSELRRSHNKIKKSRKAERQRRKKSKKRK
ncbi:preprotein translocase subunit SecA [Candidatus Parcubacteria bacterium]|nr:preprotein translocase subunit SecA [Candidatus Parcubacteria bacterium]